MASHAERKDMLTAELERLISQGYTLLKRDDHFAVLKDAEGKRQTVNVTKTGKIVKPGRPDEGASYIAAKDEEKVVMGRDDRIEALSRALSATLSGDARIENRSDFQAVIVRGRKVSFLVNFILSVCTLGIWLFVWILMSIFGGERRYLVTVDRYGVVKNQKIGKTTGGL